MRRTEVEDKGNTLISKTFIEMLRLQALTKLTSSDQELSSLETCQEIWNFRNIYRQTKIKIRKISRKKKWKNIGTNE